jgi:hypothetical protein
LPKIPEAHSHPPPKCAGCRRTIESCVGAHGDWMHTGTRSELCPRGGLARPQTPADYERMRKSA